MANFNYGGGFQNQRPSMNNGIGGFGGGAGGYEYGGGKDIKANMSAIPDPGFASRYKNASGQMVESYYTPDVIAGLRGQLANTHLQGQNSLAQTRMQTQANILTQTLALEAQREQEERNRQLQLEMQRRNFGADDYQTKQQFYYQYGI